AAVGAAIHLLAIQDSTTAERVRLDAALAGGLIALYALVLPLAFRTTRTLHEQGVRLEGQTRQLSALLDQMPAIVWSTDTDLRITESVGSGLANVGLDRKSTRLNSSHEWISYAVFCLKKKKHDRTD